MNIYSLVAADAAGNVVFATRLLSDYPSTTPGALEPIYSGRQDIYVSKLDSAGSRFVYGTYLSVTPGAKEIYAAAPRALAVDRAGNAWIASSFNALSGNSNGVGNTLIELSSDGSKILHSESSFAVFGDHSLFVDPDGNLIVIGSTDLNLTTNPDAPLRAPCLESTTYSLGNLYYRKLSSEGKQLYASYIPAASVAAFDPQGRPYLLLPPPDVFQISRTQNVFRQDFAVHTEPSVACLINPARGLAQNAFEGLNGIQQYIVPGQLVIIAGAALGPISPAIAGLDQQGNLPLELAGVRVLLDGVNAPIASSQYGLITISAPAALKIGTTVDLEVESNGLKTTPLPVGVVAAAFYLFTLDGAGRGPAAAINQDGSINSLDHPSKVGSVVSVFGAGASANAPIQVYVNSQPSTIEYAGPAPGLVPGVIQVNFRVPPTKNGTALLSVSPGLFFGFPLPAVTLEVEN